MKFDSLLPTARPTVIQNLPFILDMSNTQQYKIILQLTALNSFHFVQRIQYKKIIAEIIVFEAFSYVNEDTHAFLLIYVSFAFLHALILTDILFAYAHQSSMNK